MKLHVPALFAFVCASAFPAFKKKSVFVALFVWLAVVASAANDYERLFELRPSASPEEVDAFLREYGVPSKGSVEIEPTARERGRKFYESFHGLKIDGEYFVVYQRRHLKTGPNTDLYIFKLLCAGRRSATFHIWVSDSEQKNLDEYVHRYKECCVPSAELISKMEKIPWGTFCRRRKERGGTLDFVNGSLAAFLHITAGVPVDLLTAGKEIDALFRGNAEFLPKDAPELAEVRKSRKDEQDERKRREKIRLAEREREMLFWKYKKLADEGIFPENLVAAREEMRDDIATFRSAMEKSSAFPCPIPPSGMIPPRAESFFAPERFTFSRSGGGKKCALGTRKFRIIRSRSVLRFCATARGIRTVSILCASALK